MVEALILRTWPVHEADQIVSFFTRDQGKLKGIAKSSAKSRKRFGGALEPMTYVLASYAEKPRQELVRLDACEILASPLSEPVDYGRAAALAFVAEVLEQTLQDHDPQDAVFRLTLAVLEQTRAERIWLPVTYFGLWVIRLMGWMPEIARCTMCGRLFAGEPAYFEASATGWFARNIGIRRPVRFRLNRWRWRGACFASRLLRWPRKSGRGTGLPICGGLRLQALERHLERRLRSVQALSQLSRNREERGIGPAKKYKFKAKIEPAGMGGSFVFFPYDTETEFGDAREGSDKGDDGRHTVYRLAYEVWISAASLHVPKAIREEAGKGRERSSMLWSGRTMGANP